MSYAGENPQPELLKDLGKRIKQLRTQRGKTQAQLADFVGISPQYLSEIEQGKSNASIGILANIANELNVSLSDLIENPLAASKDEVIRKIHEELKSLSTNQLLFVYKVITFSKHTN